MKPALLVIDVQNAFFDYGPAVAQSLRDAIETINAAIALFRKKGLPVVSVQQQDPQEKLVPGEKGFDLPAELAILPSDLHIVKTYGNAFNHTSLAKELKGMGVDMVVLTGFCAEYCVLATFHGAQDLDLHPVLLRDSLASFVPKNIRFVESIADLVSFGALARFLE
jgi:nicotinamidase-related amidase